MKQWQCTICGYIHTGEEPPDICPVCGADKSLFIELVEKNEETPVTSQPESKEQAKNAEASSSPELAPPPPAPLFSYDGITNLMLRHHAHPISVHFPNGIIPMAVTFIFLAVIFQFAGLSKASFYNMVFVMLTLPAVLFTGYNEWKKKYKGALTRIFVIKIVAAAIVSAGTLTSVLWFLISPDVLQANSFERTLFLTLQLVLVGATGIAGHIGGKLVFKD
ncbi:MAG: hypothetical protein C4518_16900 [Desulfobacteraceae bacterium]|nr:MAG: hypothetical protein C4518_16900 [Desulfobacteraceae bacterium]